MKFKCYQFGLLVVLLYFSNIALADISEEYRQGLRDLESIENKMTNIYLNIEKITEKLKATKKKIFASKAKIQKLLKKKDNHLEVLKKQLKNIQRLQSEPKFKIFFDTKLYAEKVRINSYYYELRRYHINTLSVLKKNSRSLKQQQHQKSLELDELIKSRKQRKIEQQKVKLHYTERQKKIQKLKSLLRHTKNRKGVKVVVKQKFNALIEQSKQMSNKGVLSKVAFSLLRGAIQWPSVGKFKNAFAPYRLAWRVFHQEPEEVRAIADGVVTLITWIPQLGLVAIVDHGEGYQSIYGNNSIVLVKQGQRVKSQQVLSKTGSTGGQDDVGLFFQLRYKKQPVDFSKWARS